MPQPQQFLRSERLEIKPSLGDGHWVCATYNNQLPQLPPLRKQDLINAIERAFQIIVSHIWCFIPKPENNSLVNYTIIRHKRYNFDIGDIIDLPNVIAYTYNLKLNILNEQRNGNYETTIVEPLAVSNNGVLFIRRGDHYNGLVHRIYTKTVSSALRLTSARSPSYPTGSTVAPSLTSAHLPSSPIMVAEARSPTCTRPPSSSTRAHPAHGPTRVHRSPSPTRAATAHDPTVLSLQSVLQGSTRYIALHVLALHPAPQGHTRHMALHVYIIHPAKQGPPQHMTLQCSASIQFYKGPPST